jgi:NitT/TauT family transport system permease protein
MEAIIAPIVGTIRYMPVAAFIPLIILWVGIGETSKILIIFMGIFFVNVLMVADAVKFVPAEMINAAYTLGATQRQVLARVILPAISPSVIDTLRVNVSGAWNYLVIAELIASSQGLGFRIVRAQRFLQTDEIFVCILLIGAIGLGIDLLFRLLSRRLVPWAHHQK